MRRRLQLVATVMLSLAAVALAAKQQSQTLPQWQIDAGGNVSFDVASVKPNKSNQSSSINVPLLGDAPPNGGLFSATNIPRVSYIYFAFKLTGNQFQILLPQLPQWVIADHFDIQARAEGDPTKDQMRLMVQSLLEDRFKLTSHYETRQRPVFALVLDKPGKLGPQLQAHPNDASCSADVPFPAASSLRNVAGFRCG